MATKTTAGTDALVGISVSLSSITERPEAPLTYRDTTMSSDSSDSDNEDDRLDGHTVGLEVFPGLHMGTAKVRSALCAHVRREIRKHRLKVLKAEDQEEIPSFPPNAWIVLVLTTKRDAQLCTHLPSNTRQHTYEYDGSNKSLLNQLKIFEMAIQLYKRAQKTGRRLLIQCENLYGHATALVLAILVSTMSISIVDALTRMWSVVPEINLDSDMCDFVTRYFSNGNIGRANIHMS